MQSSQLVDVAAVAPPGQPQRVQLLRLPPASYRGPVPDSVAPFPPYALQLDDARRCGLYLLAAHDGWDRLGRTDSAARQRWAAAVEGVWWLASIDERLAATYGPKKKTWEPIRHEHPEGRVFGGLLWLRHRHSHDAVDSGQGYARNILGPTGLGPPFYISPGYRWKSADEIAPPEGKDLSAHLRPLYEQHIEGRHLG